MNRISAAFLIVGALYLASTASALAACENERAAYTARMLEFYHGDIAAANEADYAVRNMEAHSTDIEKGQWIDDPKLGPRPADLHAAMRLYADYLDALTAEDERVGATGEVPQDRFAACLLRARLDKIPAAKTALNSPPVTNNSNTRQNYENNALPPRRNESSGRQNNGNNNSGNGQDNNSGAKTGENKTAQEDTKPPKPPGVPAHNCLTLLTGKEAALFGGFRNNCGFKVNVAYCTYHPEKGSWAELFNCEGGLGAADWIAANSVQAAHTNGAYVYWFACKDPSGPTGTHFVPGRGIVGRCG